MKQLVYIDEVTHKETTVKYNYGYVTIRNGETIISVVVDEEGNREEINLNHVIGLVHLF